jgi:REP element-mobilizing transposase RayT
MTNHYHLLVETPDGNLSKRMRQLNGVYTQRFNAEHGRCGHVFQLEGTSKNAFHRIFRGAKRKRGYRFASFLKRLGA